MARRSHNRLRRSALIRFMTTSSEPVCDPDTGICPLPAANEKSAPSIPSLSLSVLPILRDTNVSTLNTDKGDPIPIDSLKPTPLTLLYFSAVLAPSISLFMASHGVHLVAPSLQNSSTSSRLSLIFIASLFHVTAIPMITSNISRSTVMGCTLSHTLQRRYANKSCRLLVFMGFHR